MNPAPDPSSLAARRSAASNLPSFQLPPPPELPSMQRYATLAASHVAQPCPASAGNLLTPPSTVSAEALSPMLSGILPAGSVSANPSLTPYTPLSLWPPSASAGSSSYGFGASQVAPSLFASQNQVLPMRGAFSPSFPPVLRRGQSLGEGPSLPPPPPYDLSLPPFPASTSVSAPAVPTAASLPHLALHHQSMEHGLMGRPSSVSTGPGQLSPLHAPRSLMAQRPLPTPYHHRPHPASAPAHQTTFPSSITAATPTTLHSPASAISAPKMLPMSPLSQHSSLLPSASVAPPPHLSRPYSYPSISTVSGPTMANVGSHLSLIGGLPAGSMPSYAGYGNLSQGYGSHLQTHHVQNDRPFKCDECPQRFNRNHDLKRHKRIHLAVKPFPCRHCEKSFSRKDALKRHILVKGCGKATPSDALEVREEGSMSPTDKAGERMSGEEGNDGQTLDEDFAGLAQLRVLSS